MTPDVIYANLTDGLRQTSYRMREREIRHMPVLGDHEELVGIIGDRDLRRPDWVDHEENVAHYYARDNASKVVVAMNPRVVTVTANDPIQVAIDISAQVVKSVSITPDLQLVFDPANNLKDDVVVVPGVRVHLKF